MEKGVLEISTGNIVITVLSVAIIIVGVTLVQSLKVELPEFEKGMPQFFSFEVYPEKSQPGTVFNFKIEFQNKSGIYFVETRIKKEEIAPGIPAIIAEIPLYDDGSHGDGIADDGVFSGIWDSAQNKAGVYAVDVTINPSELQLEYENVTKFIIYEENCIPIAYRGDPAEKIDVAILPSDYEDMEKFEQDALKLIDFPSTNKGLFSYEPFKSNKDKFNFYIVNQSEDLGCELGCQGIQSLVCCNDKAVSRLASQCPADQIIVIKNSKQFCGTASYYAKVCSGRNLGQVGTHEFGHTFGGLGDEYSYAEMYPEYKAYEAVYPNCDVENCPKWSSFWPECWKGCGIATVFRPTENDCIMHRYVDHFCPVCVNHIISLLDKYRKGEIEEKETDLAAPLPLEKTYIIDINYDKGALKENTVYVTKSKAPDRKVVRKVDYVGKIISFDDKTLHTFKFEFPRVEWLAPPEEGMVSYPPIELEKLNYSLLAPYFNDAKKLEVYDLENKRVLTVDLGYFSETCGNGKCENHESNLECPQDCRASMKDDLCTYEKDGVCDADCQRLDPDCRTRMTVFIIVGVFALALALIAFSFMAKKRK